MKQMNPFKARHPIHGKKTNKERSLTCYFGDCEGISRMILAADKKKKKEMSIICLWTLATI